MKNLNLLHKFIISIMLVILPCNISFAFEKVYEIIPPKEIIIKFKKKSLKKFIMNILEGKTSTSSNQSLKSKYKDWYNIQLSHERLHENKFFNAKARITGDSYRHLDAQNLIASLKIKLKKDNISGMRVFRLILPKAIGYDENDDGRNEILWSVLMEYLGFPTLYKSIVKVKLNSETYFAYLEEGMEKEFIERWGFRESPILKGDERQLLYNRNKNLKHVDAINFIIKNRSFLKNKISLNILKNGIDSNRYYRLKEFYFLNSYFAKHGLTINNRRYLFDPIRGFKIPIYYDGEVLLSSKPPVKWKNNHQPIRCDIYQKTLLNSNQKFHYDKIIFEYETRSNKNIDELQKCIIKYVINNKNQWDNKPIQIKKRREFKSSSQADYWNFNRKFEGTGKELNYKSPIDNFGLKKLPKIIISKNKKFYVCNDLIYNEKNCKKLNYLEARKYLAGRSKPKILNKSIKAYPFVLHDKSNQLSYNEIKLESGNNDITLKKNTTTIIRINENVENLNIFNNNSKTRLIIKGKTSNKFKLNVINNLDPNLKNIHSRYDDRLLTGCITFIDTTFNGGSIRLNDKKCEDALNIISSKGWINFIEIKNSSFDALDVDFSKLKINKIKIVNAENDCIDLSSGIYELSETDVSNCLDKGISTGETSRVIIDKLKVKNALTGIASKDSSVAILNQFSYEEEKDMIKIDKCISTYRKKQEFSGGIVLYKNSDCKDNYNDHLSIIRKINNNYCDHIISKDKYNFEDLNKCIKKMLTSLSLKTNEILVSSKN